MTGCFVVNIGDMMEVWTNGLWTSTKHRVVHKTGGYRVSVPFFYEPNWDAVVNPLERCVEMTGGISKYAGKVYGEHLVEKVNGNFYSGTKDAV
jgi:isopenicillin N synthase-like dioxygenase